MSPFQYMQIAVSDGFQFCQQVPIFFFRCGQCPGDDSLVIGFAMLSRVHVGCDCIFGFVPRYIWKKGDYSALLEPPEYYLNWCFHICLLSIRI